MQEKTSVGENVDTTGKHTLAVGLTTSPRTVKQPTKKTEKSITPAVAAALLTSALQYCLAAGLIPLDYGDDQTLKLEIAGLRYSNDRIEAVTPKVTTEK
jgi:hypothetical protein